MNSVASGTVTLLFTDIEGSTRLLRQLGSRYEPALAEHRSLLRTAFRAQGGERSTRPAMGSSTLSREPAKRCLPPSTANARSPARIGPPRSACGWGCTPASRFAARPATWALTSIVPRGSGRRARRTDPPHPDDPGPRGPASSPDERHPHRPRRPRAKDLPIRSASSRSRVRDSSATSRPSARSTPGPTTFRASSRRSSVASRRSARRSDAGDCAAGHASPGPVAWARPDWRSRSPGSCSTSSPRGCGSSTWGR